MRHVRGGAVAAVALAVAGGLALALLLASGGGVRSRSSSDGPAGPAKLSSAPSTAGGAPGRRTPSPHRTARGSGTGKGTRSSPGPVPSGGRSASSAGSSSPATFPVPSGADLQAALLTAAELPGGGFAAEPTGSGISLGSLQRVCPVLGGFGSGGSAQASAAYTRGGLGPDLSETLLQASVSGAETQIGQFAQVAQACGSFSIAVNGTYAAVAITIEAFPSVGDQTVALRISADLPAYGVTISGDIVAVSHHGTVIVVTNVGLPLDSGLTRAVVTQAYAKVAARW
jgi:hypothetical protein